MKKLLIVSSYRRACGIAQYLEHLEQPLRDLAAWDIDIAPLPVDLLKFRGRYARAASAKAIEQIVQKAAAADVVNIQLEPGLFGYDQIVIWQRVKKIIRASRKILITYHTVPNFQESRPRIGLGLRQVYRWLRGMFRQFFFEHLFREIMLEPHRFMHIVQTVREKQAFSLYGIPAETIIARPLSFLTVAQKEELKNSSAKQGLLDNLSLPSDARLLGCFGFLSPYKGFDVAISAMKHMPENHHLLIVGALHPEGVVQHTVKQPYIDALTKMLLEPSRSELRVNNGNGAYLGQSRDPLQSLRSRVHFLGSPSSAEFNRTMEACDAILLPYAEVGQTSSGPAAIALDLQKPTYCSRTGAFIELDRFSPGMISFSDVGNQIQLSQNVLRHDAELPHRIAARTSYGKEYNVESRAKAYLDACDRLTAATN